MENCFRNVKKIWENVYDIIISPIYYITDTTPLCIHIICIALESYDTPGVSCL